MGRRARAAVLLAACAWGQAAASAQEPAAPAWGDAWLDRRAPRFRPPLEAPAFAVERDGEALSIALRDAAAGQAATALLERLAAGTGGVGAGGDARWRRGRGPVAGPIGATEDLVRRLLALSPAARARASEAQEEAARLLLQEGGAARDAARREVVLRFPTAPAAALAARALADGALERGAIEEALLWYRLAVELSGPRDERLAARLLALRARPGTRDRAGGLGLEGAAPLTLGVRWAREAQDLRPLDVAADEARVVVADGRGLLCLDRADGRARWRHVDADVVGGVVHGAGRVVLAPALGAALLLRPRALVAVELARGAPRFTLTLEALLEAARVQEARGLDGVTTAAAVPDGAAVLAVLGGVRTLLLVDGAGAVRAVAPLWPAATSSPAPLVPRPVTLRVTGLEGKALVLEPRGPGTLACGGELPEGGPCPEALRPSQLACGRCGWAPQLVGGLSLPVTASRPPLPDDGRLAHLGDRVVITADGLVAAVTVTRGRLDPRWLLERGPGLGLDGAATPALALRAHGAEVATAAGLLVRVDPLDGAPLAPPRRPTWAAEGAAARLLALDPLVVGWVSADEARSAAAGGAASLFLAVGPDARRVGLLAGAARPVAPGLVLGGALLLPAASGLVSVDLGQSRPASATEAPALPWPLPTSPALGDGPRWRLSPAPDAVAAWGPSGVVLVEAGPGGPTAVAWPPVDVGVAARSLDDPRWTVRVSAWRALRAEPGAGVSALDAEARAAGAKQGSLEQEEARVALFARAARRTLLARVAPDAPRALTDGVGGALTPDLVLALRPHVKRGAEARDAVIAHLRKTTDPALRAALGELALRTDDKLGGKVVTVICNTDRVGVQRAGADLLVELAREGQLVPADKALRHPIATVRAIVTAALLRGADRKLLERVRPEAHWKEAEEQMQMTFGLGGPPEADDDDRAACALLVADGIAEE